MTDTMHIIVWDGTPQFNGGYLGCEPEIAPAPIEIGPECFDARRPAKPRTSWHRYEGSLVRRLEGLLDDEPKTLTQIMALAGWRYGTAENAIYWFRRQHPDELVIVPVGRVHNKGRRPLGYLWP